MCFVGNLKSNPSFVQLIFDSDTYGANKLGLEFYDGKVSKNILIDLYSIVPIAQPNQLAGNWNNFNIILNSTDLLVYWGSQN
jgi:hypothetical protein